MSLNFLSGGTNCPVAPGYDDFPAVAGGHPVTAAGATVTTPNSAESPRGVVDVECSIGGPILGVAISFGGGVSSIAIALQSDGKGNLLYVPSGSKVTYGGTASSPCVVSPVSTTPTGGLYSVSCPTLTGDDGTTCVLGESFVYFEGCSVQ